MSRRAEIRRNAREAEKKKSVSMSPIVKQEKSMANAMGVPVQRLMEWQEQITKEVEERIIKNYQQAYFRAEELVQLSGLLIAVLSIREAWNSKLNLEKYIDAYKRIADKYIWDGRHLQDGIRDMMNQIKQYEIQFEFDDIDINREFRMGEYDWRDEIDRCTPSQAYDIGFNRASVLENIIDTVLFTDIMLSEGFKADKIQKVINACNVSAKTILDGSQSLEKKILELRDKGIDIGEENLKFVREMGC